MVGILEYQENMANAAELTTKVGILEERVKNHIWFFRIGVSIAFLWLSWISNQILAVRQEIKPLVAQIPSIYLENLSDTPADPNSQAQAQKILLTARNTSAGIPPAIVSRAGQKFVAAAQDAPAAWSAAQDFLSYRTSLNTSLPSVIDAQRGIVPLVTHYRVDHGAYSMPATKVIGQVPINEAAEIHPLNEKSLNQGEVGDRLILMAGGGIELDNYFLKNVVIEGSTIIYSGGPVQLENVVFVNCTFKLMNQPNSREFANTLLSNPQTTFTAS